MTPFNEKNLKTPAAIRINKKRNAEEFKKLCQKKINKLVTLNFADKQNDQLINVTNFFKKGGQLGIFVFSISFRLLYL